MTDPTEKSLTLDRSRRLLGGVCAGLARHFDLPIWVVRLLFLVATFTFALTLFAYVLLFLIMNSNSEEPLQERETKQSGSLIRFRWRKPLYKNKARGKLQGVCAGVAEYLQVNALLVRLALLASLFFGPLGIVLYVAAAIVLDDRPQAGRETGMGAAGAEGAVCSFADLGAKYAALETRTRRLEATITSKKFHLHQELKKMSG